MASYKEISNNKQETVDLNYHYGFKVNLGYEFLPKTSIFINYGFANVDSDTTSHYRRRKMAKTELSEIYVFGFTYDIHDNITARISYNRQAMNLRNTYVGAQLRYKSNIDIAKIGAFSASSKFIPSPNLTTNLLSAIITGRFFI